MTSELRTHLGDAISCGNFYKRFVVTQNSPVTHWNISEDQKTLTIKYMTCDSAIVRQFTPPLSVIG